MPLGVLFALIAYCVYSCADAFIKGLGGQMSIFEIGFFTYVFSILPALFAKPKGERWRGMFTMKRPWMVHIRSLCGLASAVLITYSFTTISLSDSYAIVFLVPVFITILSVIVLKERVNALRWGLVLASFVGVMIVVRPGFRDLQLGHLTALICAGFSACTTTILRIIAGNEQRMTLIAVPALYSLVFNGVLMLLVPGFVWPSLQQFAILAAGGALVGTGHIMLIAATKHAPASHVAPIQYSQIIWGIVFGSIFYHEFPDAIGIAGLVVVVVAGVATVFADGAHARLGSRFAEYRARKVTRSNDVIESQTPQA